ncbi:hypothetical protein TALC_00999 [Thermoplasmatales archaeon BRNA1]|nr:hypothetical protein TALC_00999 [Thermoplasmatales archaeon BRNA1]
MTHARIRSGRPDRKGGIEGLPLELLIVIVVATVGTAILIGWMDDVDGSEPVTYGEVTSDIDMVEFDGTYYRIDGTSSDTGFMMTVHVADSSGNAVKGAVVTLSGLGVDNNGNNHIQTDGNGDAEFDYITLSSSVKAGDIGFINVHVWENTLGDYELKIPVVNG